MVTEFDAVLSPAPAALASERPLLWEFRLYAQVLIDEVARNRVLPSAPASAVVHLPRFEDGVAWLQSHLDALDQIVPSEDRDC